MECNFLDFQHSVVISVPLVAPAPLVAPVAPVSLVAPVPPAPLAPLVASSPLNHLTPPPSLPAQRRNIFSISSLLTLLFSLLNSIG